MFGCSLQVLRQVYRAADRLDTLDHGRLFDSCSLHEAALHLFLGAPYSPNILLR